MQKKLLAHSLIPTSSSQRSVEYVPFSHWLWEGGFVVIVSYILIAMGTGVFLKWLFSEIKLNIKIGKCK
ncbi:hypothetical protein C4572_01450 [Candidatus Parcubacteria bacterium]|nr:MAG: hypothetical protein C4572_01450 [Candidatus Parcubacteria bacterium]